MDIREQQSIDL